jgi:hypothetical protein
MPIPLKPSTADEGFILSTPALGNPGTSDAVFLRILECKFLTLFRKWSKYLLYYIGHLPRDVLAKIYPDLQQLGSEAISDETNSLIGNAETQLPHIKTRNVWGARYDTDRLITSTGWKELGKWGIKNGLVLLDICLFHILTPGIV